MSAHTRSIRDATRALQTHFTASKIPASLPLESRRLLQGVMENQDAGFNLDHDDMARANQELRQFWSKYVADTSQKFGAFVGVLRELRSFIVQEDDLLQWYQHAVKPVVTAVGYKKAAQDDAQDFLASLMTYDEENDNAKQRAHTSAIVCNDLLKTYLARTCGLTEADPYIAPDNAQIASQIESVLVTFGKKMPKLLFQSLDDLVVQESTRLQGLTLLSSFLQHQAPHLYTVQRTALVDHLLKCLMNDTSTTILAAALTSLIMLLPHIPSSLPPRLPRLFLIYSRLLCWEKFSPLSTESQRSLVTDDRVPTDDQDHGDVGIDLNWEKARPKEGMVEPNALELMTYFTYLYGLYPLNFMSYIRKPRKYLKNVDFPGADDFDLDQVVIRSRSDLYRQAHFLHSNFYSMTVEEELIDPKWPRSDPADVVADCHSLAMTTKPALLSPGPPPSGRLPDIPSLPPLSHSNNGTISPSISHTSLRSGNSWRDTQPTLVDPESPVLGPSDEKHSRPRTASNMAQLSPILDEFPMPLGAFSGLQGSPGKKEPQSNLAWLQLQLTKMRNELNFERWHKSQYSEHIGQLTRKNVKKATMEAETLNLINANRALKQELEQARSAREATIKDSNLTRKQANSLDFNLQERLNKLKKEQEIWAGEADELRKLRTEMKHYRDLLSTAESRELNKSHQLEAMEQDLQNMQSLQSQFKEAQRKVREYEFREFDFDQAKREMEMLQSEKETLQIRVQRHEQDRERTKRMYSDRLSELEAQAVVSAAYDRSPSSLGNHEDQALQQALALAQSNLARLKEKYHQLQEQYTDLELDHSSLKIQMSAMQGYAEDSRHSNNISGRSDLMLDVMSGGLGRRGVLESVYGIESDYGAPSDLASPDVSRSDPTSRRSNMRGDMRGLPISPISQSRSEVTVDQSAGLTWKPSTTSSSTTRRSSGQVFVMHNQTAPLGADEQSVNSGGSGQAKKDKITANSEVRVYGRGGAQNIKLKPKEKDQQQKPEKKSGGLRALKGIAGL